MARKRRTSIGMRSDSSIIAPTQDTPITDPIIESVSVWAWPVNWTITPSDVRVLICLDTPGIVNESSVDLSENIPGEIIGDFHVPAPTGGGWTTPIKPLPEIQLPRGSNFWIGICKAGYLLEEVPPLTPPGSGWYQAQRVATTDPPDQAGEPFIWFREVGTGDPDKWYRYTTDRIVTAVTFDNVTGWTNYDLHGTYNPFGRGAGTDSVSVASRYTVPSS